MLFGSRLTNQLEINAEALVAESLCWIFETVLAEIGTKIKRFSMLFVGLAWKCVGQSIPAHRKADCRFRRAPKFEAMSRWMFWDLQFYSCRIKKWWRGSLTRGLRKLLFDYLSAIVLANQSNHCLNLSPKNLVLLCRTFWQKIKPALLGEAYQERERERYRYWNRMC